MTLTKIFESDFLDSQPTLIASSPVVTLLVGATVVVGYQIRTQHDHGSHRTAPPAIERHNPV